jgi:uncharacterized membrane protein YeaQ/YmgE (transglycosylase-associated protein family)
VILKAPRHEFGSRGRDAAGTLPGTNPVKATIVGLVGLAVFNLLAAASLVSEGDARWVWPMILLGVVGGLLGGVVGRMLGAHRKFVNSGESASRKSAPLGVGLIGAVVLLFVFDPLLVLVGCVAFLTTLGLTFYIWSIERRCP